jgi:flagellar basal-body rod protein FlgC
MDVISSNVANVDSTRAKYVNGNWVPYRRKMVVLEPKGPQFSTLLNKAMNKDTVASGVKVSRIVEDETPYKLVYNPDHPDANENGYVQMPNVDPLKEMVDLISATRSYEANVTVFNASKSMLVKALDIGK